MNFKNFKKRRELPLDGEGGGVGLGVSAAGKRHYALTYSHLLDSMLVPNPFLFASVMYFSVSRGDGRQKVNTAVFTTGVTTLLCNV